MKNYLILLQAAILSIIWVIPSTLKAQHDKPHEVVYKQIDTVSLKMQVFYPDNFDPSKKYPAIIFFFGGGWNNGSTGQFAPHAAYFASKGMVAFTADYRVKSRQQTTPWESVKDARSSIRFLRKNAAAFSIDTNRIVAAGGSAGGHIAAAADLTAIDEPTDNFNYGARPDALVLFNPVINNGPGGFGYERFGEKYAGISPYHNIKKGAAPAIIFLGTKDQLIPVQQVKDYQERMKEAGSRCEVYLYEGQQHGFFNYKKEGSSYYDATLKEATVFLRSLGYIP